MSRLPAVAQNALRRVRILLKALAYSGPARQRWQHPDRVIAALGIGEGDRVADLGAGAGYFTVRLARAVGPSGVVYAVDPDPDMATALSERSAREGLGNVVVVQAPEEQPALPEQVDLVVVVNALHHLPDPPSYLRAVADHLRPGGRVAVVEALPRWYLFGHATEPEAVRDTLAEAGYEPTDDHDFLPRQSFQVFTRSAG